MATLIAGIAASSAIDTSSESIDIAGLDISSLEGSVVNFEHKSEKSSDYVGRIIKAKKIFKPEDCANSLELKYWNKCQLPFLFCICSLFDDFQPSAKDIAGIFNYDEANNSPASTLGFSIEGSKLNKEGHVITHSIARKLTLTAQPANKTCLADKVSLETDNLDSNVSPKTDKDPLSFLFKSVEIELFKSEEILEKAMAMPASNSAPPAQEPKVGLKQASASEGTALGQTKSGQNVMSHAKVHNYSGFSAEDHRNAAILHGDAATAANQVKNPTMALHHNGKMQLHNQAAASLERRANRLGNAKKAHAQNLANKQILGKSEDKLNKPLFDKVAGKDMTPGMKAGMGMSRVGGKVRHPEINHAFTAKETAQKELKRIKDAPKPNLPKSEEMDKAESPFVAGWNKDSDGFHSKEILHHGTASKEHHMLWVQPQEGGKGHKWSVMHHKNSIDTPTEIASGHSNNENHAKIDALSAYAKHKVSKSEEMDKALEAGSGLASPGQLNQGSALTASEKPKKKKKSKLLMRAEEAYEMWGKKEEFRGFMKKRLPHLTKAEIDSLGKTLLLKKTLQAEKDLSELVKPKK